MEKRGGASREGVLRTIGVRGSPERRIFSRVREGEGVRHWDRPVFCFFFFFAALSPGHWGRLEEMLGGIVGVREGHFGTILGHFGGHLLDKLWILWGSVGDQLRINWG